MCGIAGIATRDGLRHDDRPMVDRMLLSVAHRGPDDHHAGGDDRAWLGSRRLAIIDLAGGRQPIADESGAILATQNGEIYNYVELIKDLERRGHVFKTRSDTETLVHLYEEHGTRFAEHLRGMFAVALWDGGRNRLVLTRDRLGKKPLYWRLANGRLTYGSELKTILEDPEAGRVVDRKALDLYLRYQYVPAPWSILQGISKLAPGHTLTWDGGEPVIERYWSPAYEPKTQQTFEEDVEEGLELIREAVRLRLRSDVPVGSFLSGGMDSSVVTALMAEESAQPVQTFSIGFDDKRYDELDYARAVATRYGTVHTEEVVSLDAIEVLPELADHFDEPFGDSSAIPTFRVAQLASRSLKVVLTGDGGDELFGGYSRYLVNGTLGRLAFVPQPLLRVAARAGSVALSPLGSHSRLRRRMRIAEHLFGLDPDERYAAQVTFWHGYDRRVSAVKQNGPDPYLMQALRDGPADPIDRMLRADLLTYLPEDLLVKMDRATMANSLEARAPLLDHKVVEFAARLPVDRKVDGGTTKVLLRAIAKRLMPAEHVDRRKKGFSVPINEWFRGGLGDRFEEVVLAPDARSRDYVDPAIAHTLLRRHRSREEDFGSHLWLLLMFELWGRRWLQPGSVGPDAG